MVSPEHDRLKQRAARLSVLSNTILVIMKLVVGLMTGSVSIMSEAVHSGIDLAAAGIAWYSVRISGKPADDDHRFGHGKIENVAGTVEAILIFAAAVFIIWEAVQKLRTGVVPVENLGLGTAVMGISALANLLVSRHLLNVSVITDSVALEADAHHLATDVYTSGGVLTGLIAIKLTGITLLDPIIAILVAVLIMKTAWDLTQTAFIHILDARLPDEEENLIHQVLENHHSRFIEYHKLRTRKSGHLRHIDLHLVVPRHMTVEDGHALGHQISREIGKALPYSNVLIHIEPCPGGCAECAEACPKVG